MVRMKSPSPGSSTVMTSAPISPSSPAQNGAEMRVPTSRTLRPDNGPEAVGATSASSVGHVALVALGEDLFHGGLGLAIGQGAQRGVGVVHPVVRHEVVLEGVLLA